MKNQQLSSTLTKIINKIEVEISGYEAEKNPNIALMLAKKRGELIAFEAVQQALEGNNILLNLWVK